MQARGNNSQNKLLIVIAGPTAVGKTDVSLNLAKALGTEIVSCDSRQFYREMNIGTAVPSAEELAMVPHHFIGHLSIHDRYDVSRFENDAIALLDQLFRKHQMVVMTGGSGLYINAVCQGFDDLPDPEPELRIELQTLLDTEGIGVLQSLLLELDPEYHKKVDLQNPNRLLRALEVCRLTGQPYSGLRRGYKKERRFQVLKIALNRERKDLFNRIEKRTEHMIACGLADEVKNLLPYRHLNALNTVGYKELFEYFAGNCSLDQAIEKIKTNTRRYAKRQLTWFNKDPEYVYLHPEHENEIHELIRTWA
jgi:tRNA dimethylallyltransferase